jgi:hypothetical protein
MIEISTSKIRKMIVIIKNWIEKGIRGWDLGSNPHSNGENFSRLKFFFFEIKMDKMAIILGIINEIKLIDIIEKIIYIIKE